MYMYSDMPTIFMIIAFNILVFVAPIGAFRLAKNSENKMQAMFKSWANIATTLLFVVWLGISMWIFIIDLQNKLSNVTIDVRSIFQDLIFGVTPPFDVPSIQLPTAYLTFTVSGIKLILFLEGGVKKAVAYLRGCRFCNVKKLVDDASEQTAMQNPEKEKNENIDSNSLKKAAKEKALETAKSTAEETMRGKLDRALEGEEEEEEEQLEEDKKGKEANAEAPTLQRKTSIRVADI